MFVAKNLDKFRIGVKDLSNVIIACFPRNYFQIGTVLKKVKSLAWYGLFISITKPYKNQNFLTLVGLCVKKFIVKRAITQNEL